MKINLAKSAGLCFGVKRALRITHEAAKKGGKVYMLGDLVHNEEVIKEISELGIKKIKRLRPGRGNRSLLIQAHGAGVKIFNQARLLGYKIIDATCPMVKEIHRKVKEAEKKTIKLSLLAMRSMMRCRELLAKSTILL